MIGSARLRGADRRAHSGGDGDWPWPRTRPAEAHLSTAAVGKL